VILILSDDQGTLDLNCYGSHDLQTPHLDALAKRGLRFTQFYVASPVCSPSRAALLTGRQPLRTGLKGNVSSLRGVSGMSTEEITMAEMLKATGYRTALFGKWHLGTTPECEPRGQGFDEFFGHKGGCIDNWSHYMYWQGPHFHDLWRNEDEHWEYGRFFADLIVREAQQFIERNRTESFFLFLPFNLPHYPCQPPEKFFKLYKHLPEPRRSYAAAITALDAAVGSIVNHVDNLGLRKRTLIIFQSDHGSSTEERAGFGGGNAGPYRGAKFSLFEGGIRVPCIVSWPGTLPEGEARTQPATSMDWLPTLAEICGAPLPQRKLDGRSILGVLKSSEARSPHQVFHWQLEKQWAVRKGDWKLVVNGRDTVLTNQLPEADKIFLSNLAESPSETNNLAPTYPENVKELRRLHREWAEEIEKAGAHPSDSAVSKRPTVKPPH
jgi:arylsulfatase A-like enzyme